MTSKSVAYVVALAALLATWPGAAWGAPRDDMRSSYAAALEQFNNLELDAAMATVDAAIGTAEQQGAGSDPVTASLYVLRAALLYSNEGDAAKERILAALQKAATLNYFVVVPVEMRSDALNNYLQQARARAGAAPSEAIAHTEPAPACGADLKIDALLGVPDGGQAALYWRKAGEPEFRSAEMKVFSNVAEGVITAAEHGDADLEYFIYAFDASSQPVANKGLQESPMKLMQSCGAVVPVGGGDDPTTDPGTGDKPKKKPRESGESSLPRGWFNIGFGTGGGIARGTAEQTYSQFFPTTSDTYGPGASACAIARWAGGEGGLPTGGNLQALFETYGEPGQADAMMAAYSLPGAAEDCAAHHPVTTGFALAPFHIAPEVAFRLGKRISLGLFGRLQVVSGSKVFRDDPNKNLGDPLVMQAGTSYWDDVYNGNPKGVRSKAPFSWAVGVKFKYFLGKDESKFRPYIGLMAGGGFSRLMVPMGFGNDRNGNSVPDDQERGAAGTSQLDCVPVWPYNNACNEAPGTGDNLIAQQVTANAKDKRVDTVRLGPIFAGPNVGFNYQVVKNFAIFADLGVGVWFWNTTSVLFDLTLGPAITW